MQAPPMGHPCSVSDAPALSECNSMRPNIIEGFEKKSVALLDYVNRLQAQLEQLRTSFHHKEARLKADNKALQEELCQREDRLKSEERTLEGKLRHLLEQSSCVQKALLQEERKRMDSDEAARNLMFDVSAVQDLLQNERQHAKELEEQLIEMKEQLRSKELAYNRTRLKEEREKTKLEEGLTVLKKKATLGWILGCLAEVYLRLENDSESQKSDNLLKNMRKPAKLECIEREVRKLTCCQDSVQTLQKKQIHSPQQAQDVDSMSGAENELEVSNKSHRPFLRSLDSCRDRYQASTASPASDAL